ncbi:transporter, partial [Methylococcus sp. S1B]
RTDTATVVAADVTFESSYAAFRTFAKQHEAAMEARRRNAGPGTKTVRGNPATAEAEAPAAFARPPSYEPIQTYGSQRAEAV